MADQTLVAVPVTASTSASQFDGNILGNYNNPTYHIRFYTLGDGVGTPTAASNTGTSSVLSQSGITIAESGVTGYNIKEFTFSSTVSYNNESRNTSEDTYTLSINEPQGTSFADAMYVAAAQLGVKDWQKACYYIEVSFKGFNEDGTINTNLCSNFPNGGKWVYQVNVSDMEFDISTSGTTYTITGTLFHHTAYDKEIFRTGCAYSIVGTTLRDWFSAFATALNAYNLKQYGANLLNYVFDFQTFTVSGQTVDPGSFSFMHDYGKNPHRNLGYLSSSRGSSTGNVLSGQAISDIIQSAIGATVEGQQYALNATGQDKGDLGDGTYRAAGLFRVFPQVQITGFDATTQNYIRTVTFHIKMFKKQNTLLRVQEVTNTQNGAAAIADLNSYSALRKRYEGIYTGLNTEILEFTPKLKFAWQANLPTLAGYMGLPESYEQHAIYNPLNRHAGTQLDQDNATARQNAPQTASTPAAQSGSGASVSNSPIGGNGAASASQNNTQIPTVVYAEDLLNITPGGNAFTVSLAQIGTAPAHTAGAGFQTQSSRRRSLFGAILNQAQDVSQLATIDMKIKGDPYWLGMNYDSMVSTTTSTTTGTATNTNDTEDANTIQGGATLPDYSAGDNCFVVYFKYPYTTDENGMPIMKENETFNGIYAASRLTHVFSGGLFTTAFSEAVRVNCVFPSQSNKLANTATTTTATTGSSS